MNNGYVPSFALKVMAHGATAGAERPILEGVKVILRWPYDLKMISIAVSRIDRRKNLNNKKPRTSRGFLHVSVGSAKGQPGSHQPSRPMTMLGIWPACLSMEMPDCISMLFLVMLALSEAKSASRMRPLAISVLSFMLARLLAV